MTLRLIHTEQRELPSGALAYWHEAAIWPGRLMVHVKDGDLVELVSVQKVDDPRGVAAGLEDIAGFLESLAREVRMLALAESP